MNKLKMGMLFLLLLAVLCGTMTVSAAEAPYETYVFAYDSSVQITPNAYLPAEKIAAFGETLLKNPSDMVVDEERGLIAIADTGNNRIVLLNRNFEVTGTIGPFTLPNGTEDTFDSPSGVFITEEDWLVVADTNVALRTKCKKFAHKTQKGEESDSSGILAFFAYYYEMLRSRLV